jgi:hypothetical protein
MHHSVSVLFLADVAFRTDVGRPSDDAEGVLQKCDRGGFCYRDTFEDS